LFVLAGVGAGVTIGAFTAQATGWRTDDWRTWVTAAAILAAAVVAVEVIQRRRSRSTPATS
jgi:predicted MFS family arabinose efflux permease